MTQLHNVLNAFGSPDFNELLKNEIEQLNVDQLFLQQTLTIGNHVLDNSTQAMILNVSDDTDFIRAKIGIFYRSIIGGCSCADDPTPVGENNEYCEVQCVINKKTADAAIQLIKT